MPCWRWKAQAAILRHCLQSACWQCQWPWSSFLYQLLTMILRLWHICRNFGAARGRTCLIYCSLKMCFTPYGALSLTKYAGRTVNFRRRHNPNAAGQIPAYHVIRNLAPSGVHPASMYFMLPVVQVEGDRRDAVIWERAFIHGWAFKLNAPRVYHHVPLHVLRVLNPVKFGLRTGACAQTTVQLAKQAHGRRLSRTTRNRARALGVPIPQRHTQQSVFDKILAALSFEVRDRAAKHGLRLLYVLRSRALLAEIFKAVGRWASGDRLKAAKKHLKKRAGQLGMQLPITSVAVKIP